MRYSYVLSASLYLLCHVGLRKVVENKSNFLLNILWRLYNPFCLVSCYQQGVNVGCVYGGLQKEQEQLYLKQAKTHQVEALTRHMLTCSDINKAKLTGTSFLKLLGVGLVMVVVLAAVVVVVVVVTRVLG